jgi:RNA polymerase sigma factor (sigma-70 family)
MADAPLRAVIRRLSTQLGVQEAGALTDTELLQRFLDRRDEAAFEVLVWRHGLMVLGLCQRLLHDVHAAEDAFQATFLALAREAGRVARRESVGSWLYTVACRVALKAKGRAARRAARESAGPGVHEAVHSEDPAALDLRPVLDEEINRLPEKYRRPVVLCYLEGKTNTEAALQLGCPAGTVATRLAWARARLRGRLTRRGVALSAGVLATGLGAGTLRAALPGPLVESTVRAGVAWAVGRATAGAASARVAALAEGAVQMLFVSRLKKMVLIVAAAVVFAAGVGVCSYRVLAGKGGPATAQETRPPAGGKDYVRPTARQVLGEALDVARAVEDAAERVNLLVQLAVGQAEAGDRAEGLKTLQDALKVAREIEEETPKGMALREIAQAHVRVKDVPGALRAADVIQDAWRKNHLLFLIATQQASGGDVAGALRTAEAISDDQKDGVLEAAARAQAGAGDLKAALQMADRLKHQPLSRAGALEAVALAQAKAGDRAAGATLQEALRLQTATLAREGDRTAARASGAVLQARIGDVSGALACAAKLADGRAEALAGIAVERARAGDLPGALRTVDDLADPERKVAALTSIARTQLEAGNPAATRETLRAARTLADALKDADQKASCQWSIVQEQIAAGDVEPAQALMRAHPKSAPVGWVALDVGRAHLKAGNRAAGVAALRQAWDVGAALQDRGENPMGVITLVPRWALMKASLLGQAAVALAAAGEERDVLARANKLEPPYIRARALLSVAVGLRQRENQVGEPH